MLAGALALLGCGDRDPQEPAGLTVPSRYVLTSIDGHALPAPMSNASGQAMTIWDDTVDIAASRSFRHRYLRQQSGTPTVWVVENGAVDTSNLLTPSSLLIGGQLTMRADGGMQVLTGPETQFPGRVFIYRRVSP